MPSNKLPPWAKHLSLEGLYLKLGAILLPEIAFSGKTKIF